MGEHAAQLLPYLLSAIGFLLSALGGIIWYFARRDRALIDKELMRLQRKLERDLDVCSQMTCDKIEEVRKIANNAMERADQIERNYVRKFDKLHEHLTELAFSVKEGFSEIKLLLSEEYVKKKDLPKPQPPIVGGKP